MEKDIGYNYRYTSVLRVWRMSPEDSSKLDKLYALLDKYKYAYSDVIFFTQKNHSVLSLDTHRETAKILEPLLNRAKNAGLRSGIDVLCSIGFFRDAPDHFMEENYTHYINRDGSRAGGRLCPEYPEVKEYIAEQYKIYAALHPDMIYIDDDISSMMCFCPQCVKRFIREYGFMNEADASLETLNALFECEDIELRKRVRDAWIDFTAKRTNEVFAIIEKTVHSIDPAIELGFMSHVAGKDGLEDEMWADTLRSEQCPEISWRPGGGVYTEFTPNEVLDKSHRISAQIRYLPPFATRIESEIENFPYHSLRKSPGFTAFESLIYLAAGCTGTAFNICSTEAFQPAEYERYFEMSEYVRHASESIVNIMQREHANGISFPWDKRTVSNPLQSPWKLNDYSDVQVPNELAAIGLPIASHEDSISVYLLDKITVSQLSDAELEKILSSGVLMDSEALDICNQRGFGEYTGFRTDGVFPEETLGRDTDHPFNMPGKYIRDVRQAFGYCKNVYTFLKTAPEAEYLTEALDFDHNVRGMSGGIYENPYGGRIAVDGLQPFSWAYMLPRNIQMKNLFRWLSHDSLGAYILSYNRIALWQRGSGIFVANFEMEKADSVELAVCGGSDRMNYELYEGGKTIGCGVMHVDRHDGAYAIYRLPALPITGEMLIYPEK